MTAVILGINAYHWDSSACLVVDGQIVAASAEERLGDRRKHEPGFPSNAIRRVLELGAVNLREVDYVAVGFDPKANVRRKAAYALAHPARTARVAGRSLRRRERMASLRQTVASACGLNDGDTDFEVVFLEHHIAHLASSFYTSPFHSAAGFSYDAAGDFVTTMYAGCDAESVDVIDRVYVPNSLGYFYTALCQFIGFDHVGEEYKVMGLSAFGEPNYMDVMEDMIRVRSGGQFESNDRYLKLLDQSFEEIAQHNRDFKLPPLYATPLVDRLGTPRERGDEITQRDMDIAASCQKHFENVAIEVINWLHGEVDSDNLVLAGGCALNGVTNARILRDTPFKNSYIHCAATDDGLAVGAALWTWHEMLGNKRSVPTTQVYLGAAYPETTMQDALTEAGLDFEVLERDALLDRVSDHLNSGHVVGWYQGRYEWGPRALGNRSILAHPGWPGMKDLINKKIKRRENFRPFAPSILAEAVPEYFEQEVESPFMMHVVKIREEKRGALAAVCHEDGSGRLHTVKRHQNPMYYDLIQRFAEKSGTPALLNTSFNENEPIVDDPAQAISTFLRNDVDVLVLGSSIVTKPGISIAAGPTGLE